MSSGSTGGGRGGDAKTIISQNTLFGDIMTKKMKITNTLKLLIFVDTIHQPINKII